MRALLLVATGLILVVTVASAMLRLAQAGANCTPWPACYAQRADHAVQMALPEAEAPTWQRGVRLAHRITASLAGLGFLFAVMFGWRRWGTGERLAGVLLLAVTVGLALLGRYTPSPLPAVVQANLLGGHLLLAALVWLLVPPRAARGGFGAGGARPDGLLGPLVVLLMALVLAQAGVGGLVSARSAAAACQASDCSAPVLGAPQAFDPWRPNAALASAEPGSPERQAVLRVHTISGALTALLALLVSWRARRQAPVAAGMLGLLALAALALGWAMRLQPLPLPAPVAHSLMAALTLAAATAVWRRSR